MHGGPHAHPTSRLPGSCPWSLAPGRGMRGSNSSCCHDTLIVGTTGCRAELTPGVAGEPPLLCGLPKFRHGVYLCCQMSWAALSTPITRRGRLPDGCTHARLARLQGCSELPTQPKHRNYRNRLRTSDAGKPVQLLPSPPRPSLQLHPHATAATWWVDGGGATPRHRHADQVSARSLRSGARGQEFHAEARGKEALGIRLLAVGGEGGLLLVRVDGAAVAVPKRLDIAVGGL